MGHVRLILCVWLLIAGLDLEASAQPPPEDSTRVSAAAGARHISPKSAMLRSLFVPGWGQWSNGKKTKAVLAFALETGIVATSIYWNRRANRTASPLLREQYLDYRNNGYWFLAAAILLSMGDAYVDAHLSGFDVSPELGEADRRRFLLSVKLPF
jgi:hypothetical protein